MPTTSDGSPLVWMVPKSSHMGHPDFRVGGKIFATLASQDQG